MFGINKKKEKIQSLEAKVRGLIDENQQLQVERNEQRLKADSYKAACEIMFNKRQEMLTNELMENRKNITDINSLAYTSPVRLLSEVDIDEANDLPFNKSKSQIHLAAERLEEIRQSINQ